MFAVAPEARSGPSQDKSPDLQICPDCGYKQQVAEHLNEGERDGLWILLSPLAMIKG